MKEVNLKLTLLDSSDLEEARKLLGEEVYFVDDSENPRLDNCGTLDSIRFASYTDGIFFDNNDEGYKFIIKKD